MNKAAVFHMNINSQNSILVLKNKHDVLECKNKGEGTVVWSLITY